MNRDPIAVVLAADDALEPAVAALGASDPKRAREITLAVLAQSGAAKDHHREAKSLLLIGHLDRLASRFRDAHDRSRQAAHLFRSLGDAVGESAALSTLAHAATCLGRNEEAVEAALISVRLAEDVAAPGHRAMLFNYLGVAYLWSRDFDKARAALDRAIVLAEASGGGVDAFQPLINHLLSHALEAVGTRYQTGELPDLEPMAALHRRCVALVEQGRSSGMFTGVQSIGVLAGLVTTSIFQAWSGEHAATEATLAQVRDRLATFSAPTLIHAFAHWVEAELAWACGDLKRAVAQCGVLVEMSRQLEYEQMTCLGYLLLSQLHEKLNESKAAFDAMRQLRRREQLIRAETLESRERAVQWHLDLRLIEQDVQQLQGMSKHLERLSLEDSLTGLANRRALEQKLQSVLAARSPGGAPMSIAFIDVDEFKSVNDRHSHRVGDMVLRAIAVILGECIREHDIAARLSGDEFAILFQRADVSEATRVCRRISSAVSGHDWNSIATGLTVSVSIGAAAAHEGDSVESLLHRGDSAMYAAKRLASHAARPR